MNSGANLQQKNRPEGASDDNITSRMFKNQCALATRLLFFDGDNQRHVAITQDLHHALLDGLHHDHTAVEVRLLVHVPDDPIHECAEEVALAELNHLFGHHALRSELFVKWFHCSVLFEELQTAKIRFYFETTKHPASFLCFVTLGSGYIVVTLGSGYIVTQHTRDGSQ